MLLNATCGLDREVQFHRTLMSLYIIINNKLLYFNMLLQVGKRSERARTPGMYAPVARTPADRADFQQLDGDARQQETRAEKHQWSRETGTGVGRDGTFR